MYDSIAASDSDSSRSSGTTITSLTIPSSMRAACAIFYTSLLLIYFIIFVLFSRLGNG
jgi:hypothetical protein